MRAVGEVMSIGKTYKEAFQKSIRSLEIGRYGLGFAKDFHQKSLEELLDLLNEPSSERQFIMYEALRQGAGVETLYARDLYQTLVYSADEGTGGTGGGDSDSTRAGTCRRRSWSRPRKTALPTAIWPSFWDLPEARIRDSRLALGMAEAWEPVPVSGVENAAYYFSTYNAPDQVEVSARRKIMVLGGGPNRIGQGIEFDYCCVHAAFALRDEGFESIMVNCNPETVSTDYDTSDKLYFEPLTVEDVLEHL